MKDARICAFLWRKKWLGQWAKQLCVIKDTRLLVRISSAGCLQQPIPTYLHHRCISIRIEMSCL